MTIVATSKQAPDSTPKVNSTRGARTDPNRKRSGFPVPFIQRRPSCACGGGCPRCEEESLQARLGINQPGDRYEREADRMAERVTRASDPQRPENPPALQRRAARQAEPEMVPPVVHEVLRSSGRPLDSATRAEMEPRFGHDFSQVRVHTDARAAQSARAVGAQAYTVGRHVVFGAGQHAPGTVAATRLLAHELTHVVQQGGSPVGLQRQVVTAPTAPGSVAEYTGPGWKSVNQLGIVRVEEAGAEVRGARLRGGPTTAAPVLHHLDENTKVFIIAENPQSKWVYVSVANKQYRGSSGYVSEALVWRGLPDPDAVLHYVAEPGLGLQKLVENHEQYKDYDIRTGDDARSIVMAVLVANDQDSRTRGNVYLNQAKLAEAQDPGLWEGIKDRADEYRRVLRPILQSVELRLGTKIWLPGKQYIEALKEQEIIPTRPEWKNVAIAVTKGIGGFLSGLVDGFFSSIIDVFVGIYDLIKTIITQAMNLISGEAIRQAKEFYDTVKDMSAQELLAQLLEAVTMMVGDFFKDFARRWTADNTYDRWYFRGSVVGYVLAEVLMAIFSGGAVTAVKWLGKLGKLGSKLAKILGAVLKKVDAVLDKVPGRKRTDRIDPDERKGESPEKGKQLPLALSLAGGIAEAHDAKDSPVSVVLASLLPLKARFKWIDRFTHKPKASRGHYRIIMVGSEYDVDRDYTTEVEEEFEEAGRKGAPAERPGEARGTEATSVLRSRPGRATGGENLPDVRGQWFPEIRDPVTGRGIPGTMDIRIAQIPGQIARKLRRIGDFKNFADFRETFWKLVASDPILSKGWSPRNLARMRNGRPPFVHTSQAVGGRSNAVYQLNHKQALKNEGDVYNLDNIEIVTPLLHGAIGD